MGAESKIEWTDATVNFWWGCTKVGPGCDHCYAEAMDKRTGGAHWGAGEPRRKIKSALSLLRKLDADHAAWQAEHGRPRRVFIQSMSDLFDLEVPVEWFAEAWRTIEACRRVTIQIVTKRLPAIEKRLAALGVTTWPRHAGLIATAVNQDEIDRDVPRLLALKERFGIPWVGLSIEPMLGPIDLRPWLSDDDGCEGCDDDLGVGGPRCSRRALPRAEQCPRNFAVFAYTEYGPFAADGQPTNFSEDRICLDWVISGGESGPHARFCHPAWERALRDQCAAASVPYFRKQAGEFIYLPIDRATARDHVCAVDSRGRGWALSKTDGEEWWALAPGASLWQPLSKIATLGGQIPEDVLEWKRVGKKAAGRLLDGVTHDGMPHNGDAR